MSLPYGYQPQFYYATPYLSPYYHPTHISPYIPSVNLPASPQVTQRRVHFDDGVVPSPQPRSRRPSWHAGMEGMAPAPNPAPFPSPPFLYTSLPPMSPYVPPASYTHQRRRSDSSLPQPTWIAIPTYSTYAQPVVYPSPAPAPAHQLHPLIDGESLQGPSLLFDISLNAFTPRRITSHGRVSDSTLGLEELGEQATHPGVTRMKIICDAIPQWPIVLEAERDHGRSPYLSVPRANHYAPITVGDVLIAIHRTLQTQISHVDWARLPSGDDVAVARAYTRRCRTFPSAEAFEASQGVRRVDYLLDKFMFKGLVRTSYRGGFEHVKLLVGPAPRR
ncbi:hypothetical protein SCP_0210230 [Sparassis crispa]|uniref:DUF6699 domain-containing protein n=1 Tax=Sparassis crispa TaxID=139825 RepID=A0A401GCD5_9APHY|nr:hypothetical protein SCP_0210230 [Sparassis crispa]GBE79822.1 hypothetical protein SCP_0210230 [Sparassis crispa]